MAFLYCCCYAYTTIITFSVDGFELTNLTSLTLSIIAIRSCCRTISIGAARSFIFRRVGVIECRIEKEADIVIIRVMTSLIRKQSGVFSLDNSITLREIEENPSVVEARIIPISAFLSDYPAIKVTEEQKKKLLNGIRLASVCEQNVLTALYCEDELLGIATTDEEGKTFVKTWLL